MKSVNPYDELFRSQEAMQRLAEQGQLAQKLADKFAPLASAIEQYRLPKFTTEQLAAFQAIADLPRPQDELFRLYTASQQLLQKFTGETWQTISITKAHRIQRIFDNIDSLGLDLQKYNDIPLKVFIETLIDHEPEDYESLLNEQVSQNRAKLPQETEASTPRTEGALKADIVALALLFSILNDGTTIWSNLVNVGVLPKLTYSTELFDKPDTKIEESVNQHQKAKPGDEQLSNPGSRCGCDCKTCRDQSDEETPPTHEPTSTLI